MLLFAALAAVLAVGTGSDSAIAPKGSNGERVTGPTALAALAARARVPSFSRQTKLPCGACHYGFPQLTPFGRTFKLNGYTMTGLTAITSQVDTASRLNLDLSPIAPLSVMAIASTTSLATAIPGAAATTTQFPQQISLFASTAISDKMGIFSQFTYEDQSGTFGIDNVDIRYATHKTIGDRDVLLGLTLHNNPTVQDVWNTTPAWGYPFTSSAVAPTPSAAALIDGGLAQSVLGLGAYTMISNSLYAEVSGYVSAPQGVHLPLDSSAANTVRAISPYWRLAYQHEFASTYLMLGTFGLYSELYPTGVTGATNQYTDVGFDAQVEQKLDKGMLIGRASYIHENQNLTASFTASPAASQNVSNSFNSYKFNLSYIPNPTHTLTVGMFGSSGTSDDVIYGSSPLTGSSTSSPNSQGESLEFAVSPWLNVRLGAQYVIYQKFNGASTSYDVSPNGRSAKDNNALYVYLWLVY
ncbi:MAG: hypothetical protein ACHQQ3_05495 [Gemmatimonadales bacterium]